METNSETKPVSKMVPTLEKISLFEGQKNFSQGGALAGAF